MLTLHIIRPHTLDPFPSLNNTHFHLISYFLFSFVWVHNISSSDLCQTVGIFKRTKNEVFCFSPDLLTCRCFVNIREGSSPRNFWLYSATNIPFVPTSQFLHQPTDEILWDYTLTLFRNAIHINSIRFGRRETSKTQRFHFTTAEGRVRDMQSTPR